MMMMMMPTLIRFVNWRMWKRSKTLPLLSGESLPSHCLFSTDVDETRREHGVQHVYRANSFLLALASPVLCTMLCGGFVESKEKTLRLHDVTAGMFFMALDVWCGKMAGKVMELHEVKQLGSVADRFQIMEAVSALETAAMGHLSTETCGELLTWSRGCGMQRLEAEALKMAAWRFEEFARTEGFMRMRGDALGSVLDDDRLVASNEEAVWEAVVEWKRGAAGGAEWRGVVGKVRFPLMREEYLRNRVMMGMVGGEDGEWMAGVVAEALRAKAARREGAVFEFEALGRKALEDRAGLGVRWKDYREGGELRLGGHKDSVTAIAVWDERVYSGSYDGSIRVWSRASGEHERTLDPVIDDGEDYRTDPVNALAVWEGRRLISAHAAGNLRVWNVATGECDEVIHLPFSVDSEGRSLDCSVAAFAVCGSGLASGHRDGIVRVWGAGDDGDGMPHCERALIGHTEEVNSVAVWQDKVVSGSSDDTIRVWDVGTGAHDATLVGHTGGVEALVVHGDRLLSASMDGTIRAWAVGTWVALRTVEAWGQGTGHIPLCLAVSGSKLVCGSRGPGEGGLHVWGLEELDLQEVPCIRYPQQTLLHLIPSHAARSGFARAADVNALMAVDGEVWGGVGNFVVKWGRRA